MREVKIDEVWEGNSLFSRSVTLYWLGGDYYGVTMYDSTCVDDQGNPWAGYDDDCMFILGEFASIEDAKTCLHERYALAGYIR